MDQQSSSSNGNSNNMLNLEAFEEILYTTMNGDGMFPNHYIGTGDSSKPLVKPKAEPPPTPPPPYRSPYSHILNPDILLEYYANPEHKNSIYQLYTQQSSIFQEIEESSSSGDDASLEFIQPTFSDMEKYFLDSRKPEFLNGILKPLPAAPVPEFEEHNNYGCNQADAQNQNPPGSGSRRISASSTYSTSSTGSISGNSGSIPLPPASDHFSSPNPPVSESSGFVTNHHYENIQLIRQDIILNPKQPLSSGGTIYRQIHTNKLPISTVQPIRRSTYYDYNNSAPSSPIVPTSQSAPTPTPPPGPPPSYGDYFTSTFLPNLYFNNNSPSSSSFGIVQQASATWTPQSNTLTPTLTPMLSYNVPQPQFQQSAWKSCGSRNCAGCSRSTLRQTPMEPNSNLAFVEQKYKIPDGNQSIGHRGYGQGRLYSKSKSNNSQQLANYQMLGSQPGNFLSGSNPIPKQKITFPDAYSSPSSATTTGGVGEIKIKLERPETPIPRPRGFPATGAGTDPQINPTAQGKVNYQNPMSIFYSPGTGPKIPLAGTNNETTITLLPTPPNLTILNPLLKQQYISILQPAAGTAPTIPKKRSAEAGGGTKIIPSPAPIYYQPQKPKKSTPPQLIPILPSSTTITTIEKPLGNVMMMSSCKGSKSKPCGFLPCSNCRGGGTTGAAQPKMQIVTVRPIIGPAAEKKEPQKTAPPLRTSPYFFRVRRVPRTHSICTASCCIGNVPTAPKIIQSNSNPKKPSESTSSNIPQDKKGTAPIKSRIRKINILKRPSTPGNGTGTTSETKKPKMEDDKYDEKEKEKGNGKNLEKN